MCWYALSINKVEVNTVNGVIVTETDSKKNSQNDNDNAGDTDTDSVNEQWQWERRDWGSSSDRHSDHDVTVKKCSKGVSNSDSHSNRDSDNDRQCP